MMKSYNKYVKTDPEYEWIFLYALVCFFSVYSCSFRLLLSIDIKMIIQYHRQSNSSYISSIRHGNNFKLRLLFNWPWILAIRILQPVNSRKSTSGLIKIGNIQRCQYYKPYRNENLGQHYRTEQNLRTFFLNIFNFISNSFFSFFNRKFTFHYEIIFFRQWPLK